MSDKQIINIIKGIKECCKEHRKLADDNYTYCEDDCRFQSRTGGCQIAYLTHELDLIEPNNWDIEEIERIINE